MESEADPEQSALEQPSSQAPEPLPEPCLATAPHRTIGSGTVVWIKGRPCQAFHYNRTMRSQSIVNSGVIDVLR